MTSNTRKPFDRKHFNSQPKYPLKNQANEQKKKKSFFGTSNILEKKKKANTQTLNSIWCAVADAHIHTRSSTEDHIQDRHDSDVDFE